jgi:Asp-tRNA(Asn)/Glu-tRNA(Gln) amidotransferase A subunit family amidase
MRVGIERGEAKLDLEAMVKAESRRVELNDAMAAMLADADIILAATNPATAFNAEGHLPRLFEGVEARPSNNGALTAPSNIFGNPAVALPTGLASDGLPVSLQVLAPHHREDLLLDLGLAWERHCPWPLLASQGA